MFFFRDEIDLSVVDFSDKDLVAPSFQFEKDQIFKKFLLCQKLFDNFQKHSITTKNQPPPVELVV